MLGPILSVALYTRRKRAEGAALTLKAAIPLIHVLETVQELRFYRDRLGFVVQSTYQPHADKADPSYHVIARDGATLHISSFSDDGLADNVVTIVVEDIHAIYDELVVRGVDVGSGVMNQSWGNREIYVRDPAGNTLRFQAD
ncbi:MAG: hypothetical protein E5X86_11260 [Mesorhizobium sp.]|uniref:glyoxalase superfamily protein n=1 Tax=Mesorhizobium sp. TaxID=1871066 RepID=UPI000FE8A1B0|nr:glyoxalase superfamily protein [Mesorhizobium sp.]RWI08746.1 MAG: hypothetical protein EOQ90_16855 [Mesorhizobium sp.]RWM85624.1 MAG: hypothetical protein EOR83_10110 [Mesorhizobium sp.]TIO17476.1 MAG: hypothetical protein E5X86_11260 [Mesorhizobium sp.]TIP92508.1 MAG: hypothetical protein E5X58_15255 [Mesorhizobium sp.]TIP93569.1 MAG: hypothetical protein E5X60_24395 [Mesorhizobium sp.]